MPLDVRSLAARALALDVPFGDEVVAVHYRPWTEGMRAEAEKKAGSDRSNEYVNHFLATVLRDWDLTEGGEPYPLTLDGLRALPVPLVSAIFRAVVDDFGPGKFTKKGGS